MWTQREMGKHTIGRTKRQEGIWMGVWTYRRIEYRHTDGQKEGGQLCRLTGTWIYKQADRRMCRHVGTSIHRQVVRQKGRRAHTWADRRTDGEMGSCTDGRIDRLAGRQADTKADGQTGR
jgi:hypothetical protein